MLAGGLKRAAAVALLALASCGQGQGERATPEAAASSSAAKPVSRLRAEIVAVYPHDAAAYTQGLLFHRGALYESTGIYGESTVRRIALATGKAEQEVELPGSYFGEGLAAVDSRLIQLTWREGLAFVYDAAKLTRTAEMRYQGEGWGLCWDGKHLVMSDGTSVLALRDPRTFAKVGEVRVTLAGAPLHLLNELECVDGAIWANVYQSEEIVRIDPKSGEVTAVVDASGLLAPAERPGAEVLNGIAWHAEKKTFFLTGKLWPKLFEVRFVAAR
jgi:glutaminyl-peptide cyclotransferase